MVILKHHSVWSKYFLVWLQSSKSLALWHAITQFCPITLKDHSAASKSDHDLISDNICLWPHQYLLFPEIISKCESAWIELPKVWQGSCCCHIGWDSDKHLQVLSKLAVEGKSTSTFISITPVTRWGGWRYVQLYIKFTCSETVESSKKIRASYRLHHSRSWTSCWQVSKMK